MIITFLIDVLEITCSKVCTKFSIITIVSALDPTAFHPVFGMPQGGLLPFYPYGVEVYFFMSTITLPGPGEYTISWHQCCRNAAIQNLPNAYTGTYYSTVIDIKTPTLVSEVIDSSQAYVQGFYIGNNTVDSITLVNINGLPLGINLSCSSPNCTYEGDTVGCTDIFGVTNIIGQHPISFDINGFSKSK